MLVAAGAHGGAPAALGTGVAAGIIAPATSSSAAAVGGAATGGDLAMTTMPPLGLPAPPIGGTGGLWEAIPPPKDGEKTMGDYCTKFRTPRKRTAAAAASGGVGGSASGGGSGSAGGGGKKRKRGDKAAAAKSATTSSTTAAADTGGEGGTGGGGDGAAAAATATATTAKEGGSSDGAGAAAGSGATSADQHQHRHQQTSHQADGRSGPLVEVINGEIVIKEASLTVGARRTPQEIDRELMDGAHGTDGAIVEDASGVTATYTSFTARQRPQHWGVEETRTFYNALRQCGTDFTLMTGFFPAGGGGQRGRTRRQLKSKFLAESRRNPKLIELALKNRIPLGEFVPACC